MDKAPEAFRTISEVAEELAVPKHVLRFWEGKFAQLKPMKRGGGRRYYRPEDVALLRGIRFLLYSDGYTIRGVQKILREQGPRFVMDLHRNAEGEGRLEPRVAPVEIPDLAAETAKNRPAMRAPAAAGGRVSVEVETLGALADEIEACQRILALAKE
ncbi:MAG: MerR family transcriptional regulator [Methyloceanibacter sp.]